MRNKRRREFPETQTEADMWLETLAWVMDRSIPIGRWSIGLDGLLGLIPGFGDLTGGVISSLIIARSLQAGLPRSAVLRMVANVAIDSFLGSIPFVGDVFDFAYKANTKNVAIFREAYAGERNASRDWAFIIFVIATTLTLVALPILLLIYLTRRIL